MPNQVYKKKIGLNIKKFYLLEYGEKRYSQPVVIGDCKWRLLAFPDGDQIEEYMSLYLEAYDDFQPFPYGWRKYVKVRFTIVNQRSEKLSVHKEASFWFDQSAPSWGFKAMISDSKLYADGFMVGNLVKIVAEVEIIGTLDETEKFGPLSRVEKNDGVESSDLLNKTQDIRESIDVHGFQVLPSQVESVKRIFERHPNIASEFHSKNQYLRTTYMNFLLSIIKTMCQSPQELCTGDLVEVHTALTFLKDAGFKVDWLENKLDLVIEKKNKEQLGQTKLQEIEELLHELKQKCEIKKSEVLSVGTPLTFDDVV